MFWNKNNTYIEEGVRVLCDGDDYSSLLHLVDELRNVVGSGNSYSNIGGSVSANTYKLSLSKELSSRLVSFGNDGGLNFNEYWVKILTTELQPVIDHLKELPFGEDRYHINFYEPKDNPFLSEKVHMYYNKTSECFDVMFSYEVVNIHKN
jgi:hypothetical protein